MHSYHLPVLLHESVDLLGIKEGGVYVDVTFGGGGHSKEILKRMKSGGLIAFDQDEDAKANVIDNERFTFVHKNFTFIEDFLAGRKVDGILADLGVSSHQFDTPDRGFSFRFEGPLDMRMDQSLEITAADILNEMEPEALSKIFRDYGEVENRKRLVGVIAQRRKSERISHTQQFEQIIESCVPPRHRSKYLAKVYQALRIAVNKELEALENLLYASLKVLKPGGRLVVISYHSLEDRMVKRFMRSGNLAGKIAKDFFGNDLTPWSLLTRKAIQAQAEEVERNPRARSARLRASELLQKDVS